MKLYHLVLWPLIIAIIALVIVAVLLCHSIKSVGMMKPPAYEKLTTLLGDHQKARKGKAILKIREIRLYKERFDAMPDSVEIIIDYGTRHSHRMYR